MIDGTDLEWQNDAACRAVDPELFFTDRGDHDAVAQAKAVCRGCPVRFDCLDYAMRHRINHGIWGGFAVRERQRMRHRSAA